MSFFQKSKIDLKKYYIIHSSASACAISVALPLCFVAHGWATHEHDHYAADLRIGEKIQKRSRILGSRFARILGWPFLGDVLEKCPNRFGEMEQHRLPQTDGRESWEAVLWNS